MESNSRRSVFDREPAFTASIVQKAGIPKRPSKGIGQFTSSPER